MKYPIQQIDLVIAEYVVGTLTGGARRRVDTLLRERADVRDRAWFFERVLGASFDALEPVSPSAAVWRRIEQRTQPGNSADEASTAPWWRTLLVALPLAAAMAFAVFMIAPQRTPERFDRVAVFADSQAQTQWLVQADLTAGTLSVRAPGASAPADDGVYELWALPEGGAPQSLGLIRADDVEQRQTLSPEAARALGRSASLAISIEPPGGSPTGAPTGPVIGQAAFVVLR